MEEFNEVNMQETILSSAECRTQATECSVSDEIKHTEFDESSHKNLAGSLFEKNMECGQQLAKSGQKKCDDGIVIYDKSRPKGKCQDFNASKNTKLDVILIPVARDNATRRHQDVAESGHIKNGDDTLTAVANDNAKSRYQDFAESEKQDLVERENQEPGDVIAISAAHQSEEDKQIHNIRLRINARIGNRYGVKRNLAIGACVDAVDEFKQTALHFSAKNGCRYVMELLLEVGANVNSEDYYNKTPLHLSAENGHKETVEILIKAGANVNAQDDIKETPLHLSAANGHKEIVEILLKAGAYVDAQDDNQQTPLLVSARKGYKKIVEVLLKAGSAINKRDALEYSFLDYNNGSQLLETVYKSSVTFKHSEVSVTTPSTVSTQSCFITKIEHSETTSSTFPVFDSQKTAPGDGTFNNGYTSKRKDSACLETSEEVVNDLAAASSSCESSAPSTSSRSHNESDTELPDLNNIRQQVQDHWTKFSPRLDGSWQTKCSADVTATAQNGTIIIPTTINIVNKSKHITYNISHANLVNQNSIVSVHKRAFYSDDVDSSVEEDVYTT